MYGDGVDEMQEESREAAREEWVTRDVKSEGRTRSFRRWWSGQVTCVDR
jgi:hypothetical protein